MNIPGKLLYEDSVCVAYLPDDATVLGHIHIAPKKDYETIEEIPDDVVAQLFYVASYAATAVYEGLGSHGTNILCNNGPGANGGKKVIIEVVPRKEGDDIPLKWEGSKLSPQDFDQIVSQVKDKMDYVAHVRSKESSSSTPSSDHSSPQEPPSASTPTSGEEAVEEIKKQEENYMIKHLYRIP